MGDTALLWLGKRREARQGTRWSVVFLLLKPGMLLSTSRHTRSILLLWTLVSGSTKFLLWLICPWVNPSSSRHSLAFQQLLMMVMPVTLRDDLEEGVTISTGIRKHLPKPCVWRHQTPCGDGTVLWNCPSMILPRLYFWWPNFVSSTSTSFPGSPSEECWASKINTSQPKLYQSMTNSAANIKPSLEKGLTGRWEI